MNIPLAKWARKNNVNLRHSRKKAREGKLRTAYISNGKWYIDENEQNIDLRVTSGIYKKSNTLNTVEDVINKLDLSEVNFLEIYEGTSLYNGYCKRINNDLESIIENGNVNIREEHLKLECSLYKLMDSEEYNKSILANSKVTVSDYGWDNSVAILCILIKT